jgi:predicted transposase YbfD/YdcC
VLGQVKMDEKSNEITAIPQLLKALEISGCIVTIDAMGCQTEIAKTIVDEGGDYVLALKDNQGNLFEDGQKLFADLESSRYQAYVYDYDKTVDKGHGRIEIRECWTISDPQILRYLRSFENWKKLQTLSCIRSQRWIGEEKTSEDHFHIASIVGTKRVLSSVRSHWGIEIGLHWTLDLAFDEDHCRVRKDNGPENFAILSHIALNLLKQERPANAALRANVSWLAGEKTICSRFFPACPKSQFRCVCPGIYILRYRHLSFLCLSWNSMFSHIG